jgi:OmpA-OmpF porin, OOP family
MKKRLVIWMLAIVAIAALPAVVGCSKRCENCGKTVKVDTLTGIHFDFNKAIIKPEGKKVLDVDIDLIKKDKTLDISIEGHCDIVGSDEYNQQLSERRAKVVYDYFAANGIPTERMRTVGFGRKKPIVPNDSEANRAKNRRVEIRIIKARAS